MKLELPFLLEKLKGCKASWFHLGVFLGINEAELKKFESERRNNGILKCFSDTLMFWLNSGEPDLTTLVKALELSGHKRLSEAIRSRYQGTCIEKCTRCSQAFSCFHVIPIICVKRRKLGKTWLRVYTRCTLKRLYQVLI